MRGSGCRLGESRAGTVGVRRSAGRLQKFPAAAWRGHRRRASRLGHAMKPAGETHGDRGRAKSPSRMKEYRINRLPLGDGFHRMFYMSDCLRPLKLATHGLRGRLRRIASRTKLVEVTLNHTPPVSGQANDHPSCRFECCRTLIPRAGTCHQVIGARPDQSVLLGTAGKRDDARSDGCPTTVKAWRVFLCNV